MRRKFWLKNLKRRNHAENLGVEERLSLRMDIRESVDWIHLAHGRDQCRSVVNRVMNLRVP
jgi:hypothetical protein